MKNHKAIGILGGMGPQATVLLQQRLIDSIEAEDDSAHVPLLIDMNPQVPSRLDWILENRGFNPGEVLAQMAKRLEGAGAEALVMPCNTAHYFAPCIKEAVQIPFLDMVQLSAKRVSGIIGARGRVGILASPATQQIGLFKQAFDTFDIDTLYPPQMDKLLACIRRIKAAGPSQRDCEELLEARDACVKLGADCVIIGCSEFSLVTDSLQGDMLVVDTLEVLVAEMISVACDEADVNVKLL